MKTSLAELGETEDAASPTADVDQRQLLAD